MEQSHKQPDPESAINARLVSLAPAPGSDLTRIPERLLLAHARGQVLFLTGAGISRPALPDFRGLVSDVYKKLDPAVHAAISGILSDIPPTAYDRWKHYLSNLTHYQIAEIERFFSQDYDVVLGMLERRMDRQSHKESRVRQAVVEALRMPNARPAPIHRALIRLADRGGATAIVTTNFDLFLENAAGNLRQSLQTYALGGIPRPSLREDFAGILHLHGALESNPERHSDLIVTDQDFGEFYLRRRIVPDFIYDAARLFHLVLVGYSANDPPMRYLLNAIAGDSTRFPDLKERFAFVGTRDPVILADWVGRGITPIPYDPANEHVALRDTLMRWADLSAINGKTTLVDRKIKRLVQTGRNEASDTHRDLFDHLIRRADPKERVWLSQLASRHKADLGWLDAIVEIAARRHPVSTPSEPRQENLQGSERWARRATEAFLEGRFAERATIDWALGLKSTDTIQREALLNLLDRWALKNEEEPGEPWRSAWRFIEEIWRQPAVKDAEISVIFAQNRLRAGERSGSLIDAIVETVAPRFEVKSSSHLDCLYLESLRKTPKHPKEVRDLLSIDLTSEEVIDPDKLGLKDLEDRPFLISLAGALECAVARGLELARRIPDMDRKHVIRPLDRVYYIPFDKRGYERGMAPSVKLLHGVVARLVELDPASVIDLVRRWRSMDSSVHLRLWAALSRNPQVTPADEVSEFLRSLDEKMFWNLNGYPEIAELRARRFADLDPQTQKTLTARIRKLAPHNKWPKGIAAEKIEKAKRYQGIRELRRIQVAGARLPQSDKDWLKERIQEFPELAEMKVDTDFPRTFSGSYRKAIEPDNRFELLSGKERLKALESVLSSTPGSGDDLAESAENWLKADGNVIRILAELESTTNGADFPKVWAHFGWAHSPKVKQVEKEISRDFDDECQRVLSLLARLPETTLRKAIHGISCWISVWNKQAVARPEGIDIWLKVWPAAVTATNVDQAAQKEKYVDTALKESDQREYEGFDTLNPPVGRLVDVFLAACLDLNKTPYQFEDVTSAPRRMRDAIETAAGHARLIALHRMIEKLSWFLDADPGWTRKTLIAPLYDDTQEGRLLWRAVAYETRSSDVIEIIGEPMAEYATDRQLDRETRKSLVFSLIVESLHAFREKRPPAIPHTRVTQMIRLLDDEVRAHGAWAIQRFVAENSEPGEEEETPSSEELFRNVARPFLQKVWPQERTLATPGVSRALTDLPATARGAFAEAVDAIERFLVPFECRSIRNYGFFNNHGFLGKKFKDRPTLSIIDDKEKADALLRLLDPTIGIGETAIIPYDLSDALHRIREVAPDLTRDNRFQRLATAIRR
uniref:SIR2-like domain-containing protein n=1 Tax=Candidatus Kentrum sp. MB TaxID=2138164 RepID=A0A450Y0Q2_9GAMM|nr:MAG: SIR2-like domain-containing protein [Candidatus Kentron sp. MB]VFK77087.1 MAG: SIR2-like domain-containing protein [Candidatus Kentron sp. MB]